MPDRVQEIVSWLFDGWTADAPMAILEGFPGLGKTRSVQQYFRAWNGPKALVSLSEGVLYEEMLLELVSSIVSSGLVGLADAADWEKGIADALSRDGLLLVFDNFESQLDADGALLSADLRRLLVTIAAVGSGRLCIVTARSPSPDSWTANAQFRTMVQPGMDEGPSILRGLLEARGKLDEMDDVLIRDVAAWLGQNPRAMTAFVGCLVGQSVEEIIDRDSESWELRHAPRSAQLTLRLEREFWFKTIGGIDGESVTLAENLSVFRRPFRYEAIEAAGATIHGWENAKNRLSTSFLLDRSQALYELNPIVRQLCASTLAKTPRRAVAAHARAADFFARRLDARAYRDAARSGASFVEARYHYQQAGRDEQVQAIAGAYRGVLLRSFEAGQADLIDPGAARQRIPVLLAALDHDDRGYEQLRASLVQLLEVRGAEGDDVIAMRHALLASRAVTPIGFWMAYLRIAARLETNQFLSVLADRALSNCSLEPERVTVGVAQALLRRGEPQFAIRVLDGAERRLSGDATIYLVRMKSYILDRTEQFDRSFDIMLTRHRETGPGRVTDRLLEEACLLAYQHDSVERLNEICKYVDDLDRPLTRKTRALAEMLKLMLRSDYRGAVAAGSGIKGDAAVIAQLAFCHLALGEFEQAAGLLPSLGGLRNAATHWLVAVIALCNGDADTYLDNIEKSAAEPLTDVSILGEKLWLYIWDFVPEDLRPFPSYYFPRLPPRLTGLEEDLVRTFASGSQSERIRESAPLHGALVTSSPSVPDAPMVGTSITGAPAIYVQEGIFKMNSDEYVNHGQVGAMGREATVKGDVTQQMVVVSSVEDALRVLIDSAKATGATEIAAALEETLALEASSDRQGALQKFKNAAHWVGDKLADGSVAIAAGIALATFGVA
jgi:hypothetical protein